MNPALPFRRFPLPFPAPLLRLRARSASRRSARLWRVHQQKTPSPSTTSATPPQTAITIVAHIGQLDCEDWFVPLCPNVVPLALSADEMPDVAATPPMVVGMRVAAKVGVAG